MNASGFGSKVVLDLTGITYRQLDYWARTRLVGASIRQAAGSGSRRVYSFEDLVALRVIARLLDAGVSLQAVARCRVPEDAYRAAPRHTRAHRKGEARLRSDGRPDEDDRGDGPRASRHCHRRRADREEPARGRHRTECRAQDR